MKHPSIRTLGIVTVSLMMATRARGAAAPLSPDAMVAAHPLTGAELGSRTSGGDTPGQTRSSVIQGRRLFTKETFGGNGRSCESCHDLSSGTTSPAGWSSLGAPGAAAPWPTPGSGTEPPGPRRPGHSPHQPLGPARPGLMTPSATN